MSASTEPTSHLTFGDRLGTFIILEAAIVSFIAVISFLSVALISAITNRSDRRKSIPANASRLPEPRTSSSSDVEDKPVAAPVTQERRWRFLSSISDWYILFLLFFDFILCLGQILDARWVNMGMVVSGSYCMTQGILQQIGDVGVALWSLTIAFHTFAVLFFRWQAPKSPWLPLGVFAFISFFLILETVIPAYTRPDFWDVAGDWCWISPRYSHLQVGLEYALFWITAVVSFALYVPLFFCLRGNILVDFGKGDWGKGKMRITWQWIDSEKAWAGDAERNPNMKAEAKEQMAVARRMLAFPVFYTFIVLPSSIFRLMEDFDHIVMPSAAVAFAGTVYALSGLVNVSLYLVTRPSVIEFLGRALCGKRTHNNVDGNPTEDAPNNAGAAHAPPHLRLDDTDDNSSAIEKGTPRASTDGPLPFSMRKTAPLGGEADAYERAVDTESIREARAFPSPQYQQQQQQYQQPPKNDAASDRVPSEFSMTWSSDRGH